MLQAAPAATVAFDERQTCCGQPAFNAGFRDEARRVARHFVEVFEGTTADAIVVPSGSCTAMVHQIPSLFEKGPWRARAERVVERTHELSTFLVNVLERDDLGARFDGRVAWHNGCHGLRELGIKEEPRRLLENVRGTELVETAGDERCCGFGGTFSVKMPEISVSMLDTKLEHLRQHEVDAVVSGDLSCLLQIGGRLRRTGSRIRTLHLAEVLAGEGAT